MNTVVAMRVSPRALVLALAAACGVIVACSGPSAPDASYDDAVSAGGSDVNAPDTGGCIEMDHDGYGFNCPNGPD